MYTSTCGDANMDGAMVLPWMSLVKLGIQSHHEKFQKRHLLNVQTVRV